MLKQIIELFVFINKTISSLKSRGVSFNINSLSIYSYNLISITYLILLMNAIQFENQSIYPSKIICIGRNYVAHIEELNNDVPDEPVIFIKPNSAISDEINLLEDEEIHYEGEICFLIKDGELSAVSFGLDLTKRQVQKRLKEKGLPWERAKAFDGSAIFSEFIPFDGNANSLSLELSINGELKQKGGYQLMLFKPEVLLKEIKRDFTLEDGDIIMTGTPSGVGEVNSGDVFTGIVISKKSKLIEHNWVVK